MDYKPKNQHKIFMYAVVTWFVVLLIFWLAIFSRMNIRKDSVLQISMNVSIDKARNLESSFKPYVDARSIVPGVTALQVEQETIQKIVNKYQIENADRMMIFKGENLIYHRIGDENVSTLIFPGMNLQQLADRENTDLAVEVSSLVSGIRSAGDGKAWFILDPARGKEYGGWATIQLPLSSWTVVYATPETEILRSMLYYQTLNTVIIWSVILTLMSLLILWLLYQQRNKDQKIMNGVQEMVKDRTAELFDSQERYRSLVENMAEGILIIDPSAGKPLFSNSAGLKILGAPSLKEIGKDILEGLIAECSADITLEEDSPSLLTTTPVVVHALNISAGLSGVDILCSRINYDNIPALMFVMEDVSERRKVEESLYRRASEFAALYALSKKLSTLNDPESILEDLLDYSMALVSSNCGEVYLLDPGKDELHLTLFKGEEFSPHTHVLLGKGAVGIAGDTRQPVIVEDYKTWEFRLKELDFSHIGSLAAIPMQFGGELIGVMVVFETENIERKFNDADSRLLDMLASQGAAALHNARMLKETKALYFKTETRLRRISALFDINTVFNTNLDLRLTLKVMLDQVISQLNVDAADIVLYHKGMRKLEFAGGVRFRTTGIEQLDLDFNRDFSGRTISNGRILSIADISRDKENCTRGKFMTLEGFVSYVGAPMMSKGEPQGVLEIFHRSPLDLDNEWIEFLETLAGQAAMAINNASLFEGLQRTNRELAHAYDATIEGWVRMLDMRDQETEGHSQRVVNLTLKLARMAGIPEEQLVDIRRGALLHDIGKIGIPDAVLLKPGPLNDEEWVVMRTHPGLAYEMMSAVPFLRTSADIPYCHHEKWDGSGYPRKLAGEQIPFNARLFAVIDVWDALTSDRPYRKAWDDQKAMDFIKDQSGKHFDPRVIDLFKGLIGVN